MSFYWVYDYPTWMLFLGLTLGLVTLALSGVFVLREATDRFFNTTMADNEAVSEYLGVTGVFFGLVLGMVAVGAWDAFGDASNTTHVEAAQAGKLYRSVDLLPEPQAEPLRTAVRHYVRTVVDQEWPDQQRGITPAQGDAVVTQIGRLIYALPANETKEQIRLEAAVDRYYDLVDARRNRIASVDSTHLPGSLWWLVVVSTLILICLSMLMHIPNRKLDIALNVLMSALTGSILAFIIAMDNPFRGELSVDTAPYRLVYERLMLGGKM